MSDFLESLFAGQFGGIIVMIAVTAVVVFFLRALYGPRGLLRDPRWDESNARIRKEEAEKKARACRNERDQEALRDDRPL